MQTRYDRIEEIREIKNINKRDLSKKVGYCDNWYSYHFNNGTHLTAEHLKKLASVLDCTFEYLTGISNSTKKNKKVIKPNNKKICYNEKCVYMHKNLDGTKYCPFKECFNNG